LSNQPDHVTQYLRFWVW